jgi:hypothetical protein
VLAAGHRGGDDDVLAVGDGGGDGLRLVVVQPRDPFSTHPGDLGRDELWRPWWAWSGSRRPYLRQRCRPDLQRWYRWHSLQKRQSYLRRSQWPTLRRRRRDLRWRCALRPRREPDGAMR